MLDCVQLRCPRLHLDFERNLPDPPRPGSARLGLGASLGLHGVVLVAALLSMGGAEPDDAPAEQAISVAVVQVTSVSTDAQSLAETDASQNLQSAGAEALNPVESEAIEAESADAAVEAVAPDVVEATPAEAMQIDASEPVLAGAALPLTALAPDAVETVAPPPVEQEASEPAEVAPVQAQTIAAIDPDAAPVPQTLTRPRPTEPTKPTKPAETKPPVAKPAPKKPAAPAGNGGQNDADAVAGRPVAGQQGNTGTGGEAEVARYPGQVLKKLKRALRYPKGAGGAAGEVQVSFTVAANGQPSGIRIAQSSGNAAIDAAGIATVERAAPFPPIPAGANRKSWAFTVPLAFVR